MVDAWQQQFPYAPRHFFMANKKTLVPQGNTKAFSFI